MKYFSTRDKDRKHGFSLRQAAFMGLAPDGGLFIPEYIPKAEYGMSSVRFAEDSLANPKVCVSLVMGEKPEVVAQTIKETRTEKSQKAETSVKKEEKRNSQSQKSVKKQFPQKKKGMSK